MIVILLNPLVALSDTCARCGMGGTKLTYQIIVPIQYLCRFDISVIDS